MGIPVPPRLTQTEIAACERFSLHVWGVGMFDHAPSHNGRHGHTCDLCSPVLTARDAERDRVIRQPWELAA